MSDYYDPDEDLTDRELDVMAARGEDVELRVGRAPIWMSQTVNISFGSGANAQIPGVFIVKPQGQNRTERDAASIG